MKQALCQLVDERRVGTGPRFFHDAADEGAERLVLAGAIVLDGAGVGLDNGAAYGFDLGGVADLGEPFFLHDGGGIAARKQIAAGVRKSQRDAFATRIVRR